MALRSANGFRGQVALEFSNEPTVLERDGSGVHVPPLEEAVEQGVIQRELHRPGNREFCGLVLWNPDLGPEARSLGNRQDGSVPCQQTRASDSGRRRGPRKAREP